MMRYPSLVEFDAGCPGSLPRPMTRRECFRKPLHRALGSLALSGLMAQRSYAGLASDARLTPRAKHVIFCFMDGGPSHVDTFDPKPLLTKHQGQAIGEGRRFHQVAERCQPRLVR